MARTLGVRGRKLKLMGKSLTSSPPKKQSEDNKVFECVENYLIQLKTVLHRSPQTLRSYRSCLESFFTYLELKNDCDLSKAGMFAKAFSTESLKDFLRDAAVTLDARSQAQRASALRSFMKWAHQSEILAQDFSRFIERPKIGKKIPKVFGQEALKLLAEKLREGTCREEELLFELLYGSGLRIFEASSLKWKDIQLESETLQVLGKGRRRRALPLTRRGLEILREESRSASGPESSIWKRARSDRSHRRWVASWNRFLQVPEDQQQLHPHLLRHSLATHLLQRGAGLPQIQKLLGHRRLETTQNYTHLDLRDLQKIYSEARPKLKKG
jgi:integrase/recombinase XerC